MRWAGHVSRIGEERKLYKVSEGMPEGKRPHEIPSRWVNGIRMDLSETGCGVKWIQLAQDRDQRRALVNMVINLRVLVSRS
jgi:hypothetical protein